VTIANDVFRVFISHKHEDHALAVVVKEAIQSLNKDLIDCFVSGVDITAGTNWRRETFPRPTSFEASFSFSMLSDIDTPSFQVGENDPARGPARVG